MISLRVFNSEKEIASIRQLTKNDDLLVIESTDQELLDTIRKAINDKEQDALIVLGRAANWCKAYHERIGYKAEPIKSED